MLDEPAEKRQSKFYVCPCCIFSFQDPVKFIAHLTGMKAMIEKVLAEIGK